MPELPEVETLVRKLCPVLVGRTIAEVEVLWAGTLSGMSPEAFAAHITGARITALDRRGKFIQMHLNTGKALLIHLRMSGRFELRPPEAGPGEHKHARVRLRLDNGSWLVFINMRKFGRFYLVDEPEEIVAPLGPEPLAPCFTAESLAQQLEGRRGELKRLLLNQHFLAGLGNIYVSEALWEARIHPQRVAGSLNAAEVQALRDAIVLTLKQGIQDGGTSLEDRAYVYPDGNLGQHQESLKVYGHEGEPCPRCGEPLRRIVQGQRSTYFCPECQQK